MRVGEVCRDFVVRQKHVNEGYLTKLNTSLKNHAHEEAFSIIQNHISVHHTAPDRPEVILTGLDRVSLYHLRQ